MSRNGLCKDTLLVMGAYRLCWSSYLEAVGYRITAILTSFQSGQLEAKRISSKSFRRDSLHLSII